MLIVYVTELDSQLQEGCFMVENQRDRVCSKNLLPFPKALTLELHNLCWNYLGKSSTVSLRQLNCLFDSVCLNLGPGLSSNPGRSPQSQCPIPPSASVLGSLPLQLPRQFKVGQMQVLDEAKEDEDYFVMIEAQIRGQDMIHVQYSYFTHLKPKQ